MQLAVIIIAVLLSSLSLIAMWLGKKEDSVFLATVSVAIVVLSWAL